VSRFPGLRGVEALATSIPLFLLLFAATYVVLATIRQATSAAARLVVTGQMIADLVTLGLAVKVIVGAVKQGRQREPAGG